MTKESVKKLLKAGYTIIRKDDHPSPRIKYQSKDNYHWRTLGEPFKTKADRDREYEELQKLSLILAE